MIEVVNGTFQMPRLELDDTTDAATKPTESKIKPSTVSLWIRCLSVLWGVFSLIIFVNTLVNTVPGASDPSYYFVYFLVACVFFAFAPKLAPPLARVLSPSEEISIALPKQRPVHKPMEQRTALPKHNPINAFEVKRKDSEDEEEDGDNEDGDERFSEDDIEDFDKRQQEQLREWEHSPEEPITVSANPIIMALQKRIGRGVGIKYHNSYRVIVPIKFFRKTKYKKSYVSAVEDGEVKTYAINNIQIVCPGCGSDEAIGRICPKCGYDLDNAESANISHAQTERVAPAPNQKLVKTNINSARNSGQLPK
jgi:ribosomal protein L32